MGLFLYFIFSLCIAICGIKRAFNHRSFIILVWIISLYYIITSFLACHSPANDYIPIEIKLLYFRNLALCLFAFLLSDLCLNNRTNNLIRFETIPHRLLIIIEVIFWGSLAIVYFELYGKSYEDFVTSKDGGGWGLVLLQVSSSIFFYYSYKKSWIKIVCAVVIILFIIFTTHVRSLLLYPLLTIILYYINKFYSSNVTFRVFCKKLIPISIITIIIGLFLSAIRTGRVSLPETNLTDISLAVLNKVNDINFQYQGFNSLKHYLWGFISPVSNVIGITPNLPDSIPLINATYQMDFSYSVIIDKAMHYPANIFHDLYLSWGNFAFIFAFGLYSIMALIIHFIQSKPSLLLLMSSIFTWHIYMLLRGSVDYSSMGISYAIYIIIFMYCVSKIKLK